MAGAAAAAAESAGGDFSHAWTTTSASRDPFHIGQFFSLVWENTSGYLLAACLVSMATVLLSWVYMVRAVPGSDGPDRRTRTTPSADRVTSTRSRRKVNRNDPSSDTTNAADDASNAGSDDASDADSDDSASGPPPPPPVDSDSESGEHRDGGDDDSVPDLVEMAHHLPARMKQAELRHIRERLQSDMTEQQRRREREVERDQMAAILDLMQQNSDKFGKPSLDDMQAQLKLYM